MTSEDQGEDQNLIETYLQDETEFYKPNLKPFEPPRYIPPKITSSLIDIIRRNRLLILGGSTEIDKAALARHLAWSLCETLKQTTNDFEKSSGNSPERSTDLSSNDGFIDEDNLSEGDSEPSSATSDNESIRDIPIMEWYRSSSDTQHIEAKLLKTATPTIFILPKISPQDVRYDLLSIKKAANNRHFILASTDIPVISWKLPKEDQYFWHELTVEDLFDNDDLVNMLMEELGDARESLPDGFVSDQIEPHQLLGGHQKIEDVAKRLKSPDIISNFVQLLCAEKKPLQPSVVEDLINLSHDKGSIIKRWYPSLDSSHEQLLALGISFFEGLFDDQFFAAMERVIEKVWKRGNPSLCALDYCDLDKFRNIIFDFVTIEGHGTLLESRIPELRREIFSIAWNSHRRHILAALPVIAKLAIDSVGYRSFDPELYDTPERRRLLRAIISDALCDICVISQNEVQSIDAIQPTLLQLASDKDQGVQAVAARALAKWRNEGFDTELFKTLQDWQLLGRWSDSVEENLKQSGELKKDDRSENPEDYIRATIALTVGYAARDDPPNKLDNEIIKLLNDLAKDKSPLVRNRFRYHTLPNVVLIHTKQLQGFLHDIARYTDLIPAISNSLALAYRFDAEEVLSILDEWHKECRNHRSALINPNEPKLRDKLLAIIVMTYGYIKYDEITGPLSVDQAFKRMQNILAEETHPFIRNYVVIAISLQAFSNFEKVEHMLQGLVSEVYESESNKIVKILKDVYLEQRGKLKGGDGSLIVEGKKYPLWIDSERPLTAVEKAMFRWIKDPNNPVAQKIATRASVAFADAFEQNEAQQISDIRESRNRLALELQPEISSTSASNQLVQESHLIEKIAIWIATVKEKSYGSIIKGLLPEVLTQNKSNKSAMTFVLEKWHQATDTEIRTIAKLQDRAIWLVEHGTIISVIAIGAIVLLFIMPIPKVWLLIIILAFVLWWYRERFAQLRKTESMKNLSLKDNAMHLWKNLFR